MSYYQKYLDGYTRGFMGFNTLAILSASCLGSIAAMLILQNGNSLGQMIQLFFVVIACTFFNGSILSQQKPKVVFNMLIGSVVVSTLFIIINLFII